jgi:hypothetical protein
MSDRASQIILLCEDRAQEGLTRAFLKECGMKSLKYALKARVVGGFSFVLDQFAKELKACRIQRKAKTNTLLIVLIDADLLSVEKRRDELLKRATSAGLEKFGDDEPAVLLIPKRNIETWLKSLHDQNVNEEDDYKGRKKPSKEDFRLAAKTLREWCISPPKPDSTCVPSLRKALPDWIKVSRQT